MCKAPFVENVTALMNTTLSAPWRSVWFGLTAHVMRLISNALFYHAQGCERHLGKARQSPF